MFRQLLMRYLSINEFGVALLSFIGKLIMIVFSTAGFLIILFGVYACSLYAIGIFVDGAHKFINNKLLKNKSVEQDTIFYFLGYLFFVYFIYIFLLGGS